MGDTIAPKKVIFVDRDGTLLAEPADEQIDRLEKCRFVSGAISGMKAIAGLGYELVMVTNQDGLGTPAFPEETFWPYQHLLLDTLEGEGIVFDNILIDKSFPEDNAPTRKPRTGLLGAYLDGSYDLAASFVIGDRDSDVQLAANGDCRTHPPDGPPRHRGTQDRRDRYRRNGRSGRGGRIDGRYRAEVFRPYAYPAGASRRNRPLAYLQR